ncbi:hypothetical protein ACRTDR_18035 [Shewanella algae]
MRVYTPPMTKTRMRTIQLLCAGAAIINNEDYMSNDVSLAEIKVGKAKISFEIPTSLFNIISSHAESDDFKLYSYNAEAIIDILRSLVPEDKRPPTHRQESYARSIAQTLKLELNDDILSSTEKCSEFLDLHSEQYQQIKAERAEFRSRNKALISQANRVNRWLSAAQMLESGIEIDKVAEELGVKPPTIEKYLVQLESWVGDSVQDGTYQVVMKLVERKHNGEDIYTLYDEVLE